MDTVLGVAVVVATFAGPIAAVWVTRLVDIRREKRARQLELFRSLMGSRRAPLSPDRIRALNLVEIEFYKIAPVQAAFRTVMEHINIPAPQPANWPDRMRSLLTKLLYEMGKALGYDLQQLELLEGGYYPHGAAEIETEQQALRRLLIDVAAGRRSLPITQGPALPPSVFPPAPPPPSRSAPTASAPL